MNYKRRILLSIIILIVFLATLWNCKDQLSDGSSIVFPASNVSYGRQVQPLFLQVCAFSGCHGADMYATDGYAFDTYEHATARAGIIVPCRPNQACNPENSILVQSIEGLNGLQQMPLDGPALNSNQINGIKTWIKEGAQNN